MNKRRIALRSLLAACTGGLALLRSPVLRAQANARPLLRPDEPVAKAIGYVEVAAKVDVAANPGYRRGQSCTTCVYVERSTAKQRGCSLVPGRTVLPAGWCQRWKLTGTA